MLLKRPLWERPLAANETTPIAPRCRSGFVARQDFNAVGTIRHSRPGAAPTAGRSHDH